METYFKEVNSETGIRCSQNSPKSRSTVQMQVTSYLGSVSSREFLDAPAILATFTAGRTGLVIV